MASSGACNSSSKVETISQQWEALQQPDALQSNKET